MPNILSHSWYKLNYEKKSTQKHLENRNANWFYQSNQQKTYEQFLVSFLSLSVQCIAYRPKRCRDFVKNVPDCKWNAKKLQKKCRRNAEEMQKNCKRNAERKYWQKSKNVKDIPVFSIASLSVHRIPFRHKALKHLS